MTEISENPFEPRLGRIRSGGRSGRGRTLMSKVARSVSRAGSSSGRRRGGAKRYATRSYSRRVIVKVRFVRTAMASPKALAQHLRYISRDAATRESDRGRVFDAMNDDVDRGAFVDAAKDDRHHFRFIISPEDGTEMADLKPFVRDLAASMEKDLGTRLEWVAAIHDNTDYPHAHMVIRGRRDDGRDLVMPRAYISHGVRDRAEDLVNLELGPQSQREKDLKLARQTSAERLTDVDRSLAKLSNENGDLNLAHTPIRYRAINAARLNTLTSLGLARKSGSNNWQLAAGFQSTLKELGERSDIIKQMNRALRNKSDRVITPDIRFPGEHRDSITGAVLRVEMMGEGHDEPHIIIDGLDGRVTAVRVDQQSVPEELRRGMIVTLMPIEPGPKPADVVITKIANTHDGVYSTAYHQVRDPGASPEFIGAHVRRLEALRRRGIAERRSDGSWQIPPDYLQRVSRFQEHIARKTGPKLKVESWASLSEQSVATGLTWLDGVPAAQSIERGFGEEVRSAQINRRAELVRRGIMRSVDDHLKQETRALLERAGLDAIGEQLSRVLGKPYTPIPKHGAIEGIYRQTIVKPEGKYAVLDRQRSFTLAPWKSVMDRARGKMISGTIRGRSISWSFGRSKGRSF